MKAVYFDEHGGADVLVYGDFPDPEPGPGDVRLQVIASSLNYLDIFSRRGMPGIKVPLPSITGGDCVGRVESVGRGVDVGWIGRRVLVDPVLQDPDSGRFEMLGENRTGAMAELVCVSGQQLIPLPDEVDDLSAACLPVAYGTAMRMLYTRGKVRAGQSVLVLGASGGVGTAIVLLARLRGAKVVAAAGTDDKCAKLMEIGADDAINYSTTHIVDHTRRTTGRFLSGGGYDIVINNTGGDTWASSLKCVKRHGRLITCGATAGHDPKTDIRYIWTGELDVLGSSGWERADLEALIALVADGSLTPVIDSVHPLSGGIDAVRRLENRQFFGKLVVTAHG